MGKKLGWMEPLVASFLPEVTSVSDRREIPGISTYLLQHHYRLSDVTIHVREMPFLRKDATFSR